MTKVLCINNGYKNMKTIRNTMFNSLYKANTHSSTNIDTIYYDGVKYIIGVGNAIKQSDKTNDIGTKLLILNTICKVAPNEDEIILMLTTPPLFHKQQKEVLPKFLKGTYEFFWNNKYKKITIKDVNVLPETILGYYPNNKDGKYNKSKLLIFDVGGYTTNVCKIDCGNFTDDDYITIEQGMYSIDLQLSQYLNAEYIEKGLRTTPEDIQHYREYGLIVGGKDLMIQEIEKISDIYEKFIDKIVQKCSDKNWDLSSTQKLILGGGGEILYDAFESRLEDNVTLGNNPIFDTLNGLVMFAISIYGKEVVLL